MIQKLLTPLMACTVCTLVAVGLVLIPLLDGVEKNYCMMTYMLQWPNYVPVTLPPATAVKSLKTDNRYGLYYYVEGHGASLPSKFSGLPVLFIPGNAGSHKQVRSLASVALQMRREKPGLHFDFFAVDFDEELSGLYGGALLAETEYVHRCLAHIYGLYSERAKAGDPFITLVGHSMGGIVARGLFNESTSPAVGAVATLVTIATPHMPVAVVDHQMDSYYGRISRTWEAMWGMVEQQTLRLVDGNTLLNVVSIGAGNRDTHVRADLTHVCPSHDEKVPCLDVATTAMHGAWVSCDHKAAMWCKQVMISLARALFDCIDSDIAGLKRSAADRNIAFRHHLVSHERMVGSKLDVQALARNATEAETGSFHAAGISLGARLAIALPLEQRAGPQSLSIFTTEALTVHLCADRDCSSPETRSLADHISSGPYNQWEFKGLDVKYDYSVNNDKRPLSRLIFCSSDGNNLYNYALIAVNVETSAPTRVPSRPKTGFLAATWTSEKSSVAAIDTPWWYSASHTLQASGPSLDIRLAHATDILSSVSLHVSVRRCTEKRASRTGYVMAVDQCGERHVVSHVTAHTPLLFTAGSCLQSSAGSNGPPHIRIWTSSTCELKVVVSPDYPMMAWKALIYYGLLLPVGVFVGLAVGIYSQWEAFSLTGAMPTLLSVINERLHYLPLYGLAWHWVLHAQSSITASLLPAPLPPAATTVAILIIVSAGLLAIFAACATLLTSVSLTNRSGPRLSNDMASERQIGVSTLIVVLALMSVATVATCLAVAHALAGVVFLLGCVVVSGSEASPNARPPALLLAIFAILPMAGELASWAKNALNHGELALDPAYTHGATLTALMVIDFLAATSTVLLLACTLVGSTRALSRLDISQRLILLRVSTSLSICTALLFAPSRLYVLRYCAGLLSLGLAALFVPSANDRSDKKHH